MLLVCVCKKVAGLSEAWLYTMPFTMKMIYFAQALQSWVFACCCTPIQHWFTNITPEVCSVLVSSAQLSLCMIAASVVVKVVPASYNMQCLRHDSMERSECKRHLVKQDTNDKTGQHLTL